MDYCYYHYKLTARKLQMAQKLKQKLELKALIAQQKAEEKQKKLDAKNELKALGKKGPVVANTDENVVLSAMSACQAILKSGPRKGHICGGAVKLNNCCTRHNKVVEIV
jgi:hypothetical protein